ncbi:hypothetical protein R3P38DRAFT_3616199 [Favolaschia claudopus]|uniref:Uncharacterized protein n=1 Tax=Favolaschia claudopus TaxID=2862362 RepID=A0AAW0A4U1_9AGAR
MDISSTGAATLGTLATVELLSRLPHCNRIAAPPYFPLLSSPGVGFGGQNLGSQVGETTRGFGLHLLIHNPGSTNHRRNHTDRRRSWKWTLLFSARSVGEPCVSPPPCASPPPLIFGAYGAHPPGNLLPCRSVAARDSWTLSSRPSSRSRKSVIAGCLRRAKPLGPSAVQLRQGDPTRAFVTRSAHHQGIDHDYLTQHPVLWRRPNTYRPRRVCTSLNRLARFRGPAVTPHRDYIHLALLSLLPPLRSPRQR